MQKLFGKNHEEIGSLDKNLVLQTAGKIKIHYGRRYFDLLNDKGELNVKLLKLILPKKSIDEIDENGFYFVDGNLVAYIDGQVILLSSGGEGSTYVSFIEEQNESGDAKERALTNIGFLYKNIEDVKNPPTNGIIYVESEKSFYIVLNGEISKYSTDFPNPYPERFVVLKIDLSSNGAIYIMGEGILNSLYFDGLAIFQEGGKAFYESDIGHAFYVGGLNVFNITSRGAETNSIQSEGASSSTGYRIRQEGGRYILDIDSINVRDGVLAEESLIPIWYYNGENMVQDYSLDDDNRNGTIVLKYNNIYLVGDKIQVYTEFNPDGSLYKQVTPYKGTITSIDLNYIQVTFDNEVIGNLKGKKINLIERGSKSNNSLVIGEIGSVYNGENEGIISKLNIFYSGQYTTEESSDALVKVTYPFYSDELYAKFELLDSLDEIPSGMEKIIPPYGKIKLNDPLKSINNSNLGMPTGDSQGTSLLDVLDELLLALADPDYDPSFDNVPLNESPQVIAYDDGWEYLSVPSAEQFGTFLGKYSEGLTSKINALYELSLNYIKLYALSITGGTSTYETDYSTYNECVKTTLANAVKSAVPVGTIIMWGLGVDAIPEGWHICDGTNGTPNLQDRFVIGASSTHAAGSTGGSTDGKISFTLTLDLMPKHRHKIVGEFGHLGDPDNMRFMPTNENGTINKNDGGVDDGWTVNAYVQTAETGKSQPVEIEYTPPYYALIYIMKISEVDVDFTACGEKPEVPDIDVPDPPEPPKPEIKKNLTDQLFGYSQRTVTVTEEGLALPQLRNTEDVDVTYTALNPSVATISSTGKVTIRGNGTTNIKAIFEGNDEYNPKESGYFLKVDIQDIQPKTELEELIEEFEDEFDRSLQEGAVNEYLTAAYNKAKSEFNGNTGSWDPEIYEDNGILSLNTSGGDSELAFKAYVSWLFAQILTELDPSKSNNLFELAYQLGGGDKSVYETTLKNNTNVNRITSTVLYAKEHNNWSNYISNSRSQLGLPINTSTNIADVVTDNNFLNYFPDGVKFNPKLTTILNIDMEEDLEIDLNSKERYGILIDPDVGLISETDQSIDNLRAILAIIDDNSDCIHFANIIAEILGLSTTSRLLEFVTDYRPYATYAYNSLQRANWDADNNGRTRPCKEDNGGYPLQDLEVSGWDGENPINYTPRSRKSSNYSHTSYPSGHSSSVWGLLLLIIQKYPNKYKELAKRAWIFANNRVVARFHFFSDTIHGRITGGTILSVLNHYNSFIQDLNSL